MSHTSMSPVVHVNASRHIHKLVCLCAWGLALSALSHSVHLHVHTPTHRLLMRVEGGGGVI